MITFNYDYVKPKTLDEALEALQEENSFPILGGTDLIVKMRADRIKPKLVVDLKGIDELFHVDFSKEEGLVFGAGLKLNVLAEEFGYIKEYFPTLYQGIRVVGGYQTRNRATVVGNICNASPASDTAPALLTYNAKVNIVSSKGGRTVELKNFFKGPGKTVLEKGEIVKSIFIPYEGDSIGRYYKVSRIKAVDLSTIGVALTVIDPEGKRDIRVALASVAPTPVRVFKAEEFIKDKELTPENVEEFAQIIQDSVNPITDARGTAEYRKRMAKILPIKLLREMKMIKEGL
ncbi:carbon-monoxide dehydrogenase medium subunit [Marinitoga hydrogenitolerans DSM 16785]|uniref:Carbon-monoxide dehydrogenase medium subunit n=1 Tax=Marinitoga hydrogenitolerans (strain DSM 16785 / JCM 12826 / AT1271) TaxID=1122195 RepID=A0A1M4S9P5_MARH1|nr:xanthine dehydrogenase family protein subunit M [Marinitoga hydrogenitolerans]SHE28943.1 carbon-monoxide dehydrogenase medium subunit [Marinitoga hydrogenitolerans DSM 16785]